MEDFLVAFPAFKKMFKKKNMAFFVDTEEEKPIHVQIF